jgi:hypothetical protein
MDVPQIRRDLTDQLRDVLPHNWTVMPRLKLVREVWHPPIAVVSTLTVRHDFSFALGQVDVTVVLATELADALDDAADVDEFVSDTDGSAWPTFLASRPSSESWVEIDPDTAQVSDQIPLGPLFVRGAEWNFTLLCPR